MSEHADLPPATHETYDVPPRPLMLGGLAVLVILGALTGLVGLLYHRADNPHLVTVSLPGYPNPVLQPDPAADMAKFRAEQLRQLQGTWWVDRTAGLVHQPIDDAMQRLAAQGIPDWPTHPVTAQATPQARAP